MTTNERTHDQLLADLELTSSRLQAFDILLDDVKPKTREPFVQQHSRLALRCSELHDQLESRPEVKIETAYAIEDLGAAVDGLEADLDATRHADPMNYRAAVDKQLRSWRSRTDWLRLQGALASMEVCDDLDNVGNRLSHARAGVLVELREAAGDTKHLVTDVRDDVEAILVDIRHAVERAADALMDSTKD